MSHGVPSVPHRRYQIECHAVYYESTTNFVLITDIRRTLMPSSRGESGSCDLVYVLTGRAYRLGPSRLQGRSALFASEHLSKHFPFTSGAFYGHKRLILCHILYVSACGVLSNL